LSRKDYLALVRDLLSGEPARVREANRLLYACCCHNGVRSMPHGDREADLVLAEVPQVIHT
jgi:hypothetical protein